MPSSEYMRDWRLTDSGQDSMRRQKRRDKARKRALSLLAKRHKDEFEALLTMFLAELEREEQDQ